MNENKIRGLVLGQYTSITAFAKAANWSRQKASYIINGKSEPSLDDIYVIAKAIGAEVDEVASIFLKRKTQKCV